MVIFGQCRVRYSSWKLDDEILGAEKKITDTNTGCLRGSSPTSSTLLMPALTSRQNQIAALLPLFIFAHLRTMSFSGNNNHIQALVSKNDNYTPVPRHNTHLGSNILQPGTVAQKAGRVGQQHGDIHLVMSSKIQQHENLQTIHSLERYPFFDIPHDVNQWALDLLVSKQTQQCPNTGMPAPQLSRPPSQLLAIWHTFQTDA